MMDRRIVLISELARHAGEALKPLQDAGFRLEEAFDLDLSSDEERISHRIRGAWATVAGGELYSRRVLSDADSIRGIARCGVGYEQIDMAAATERGVAVLLTPGANAAPVADLTIALMLGVIRNVRNEDASVRRGQWRVPKLDRDLTGATVGIVGLGHIGREVARRLVGFNCRLIGVDPAPDIAECGRLGIELMSLEDMLPQLDVLTLHSPLTVATQNLIGASELSALAPHAVVVNVARGGLIDEAALYEALKSSSVAGAGLDVYLEEPLDAANPLTTLSNVLLSGHSAGFTRLSAKRTMESVVRNLLDLESGRSTPNCLNPETLTS